MIRKKIRGFTLVEVLIVIAIISILAGIAIVSVSNVRKKTRDARRITDFNNIEKSLRAYRDTVGTSLRFPDHNPNVACNPQLEWYQRGVSGFINDLKTEGFFSQVPIDPSCELENGPFDPCCGYAYGRFTTDARCLNSVNDGSIPSGKYFMWLGVNNLETVNGTHPENPGFQFDCRGAGSALITNPALWEYWIAWPEDF